MNRYIELLIEFGLKNGMIESLDIPLVRNQMMSILCITEPYIKSNQKNDNNNSGGLEENSKEIIGSPSYILNPLLDLAVEAGLISHLVTERDILDATFNIKHMCTIKNLR
jgi:galactose-1-phosphate uridylyltransferase